MGIEKVPYIHKIFGRNITKKNWAFLSPCNPTPSYNKPRKKFPQTEEEDNMVGKG